MDCLSALPTQLLTLFLKPQEVIFFQHKVYYEYAKIAVSPDFIHTFPTFIIFLALVVLFWKHPLNFEVLPGSSQIIFSVFNKILQMSISWSFIHALVWIWLISQQVIYCTIWVHWSSDSEHLEIIPPWWQRVWHSYFPPTPAAPILCSSFLSWIICMSFALTILSFAVIGNKIKNCIYFVLKSIRNYICHIFNKICLSVINKVLHIEEMTEEILADKSDSCSIYNFCNELGNGEIGNNHNFVYPNAIINARGRKPSKSAEFVKAYETFSTSSSARTSTTNADNNSKISKGLDNNEISSGRQLRLR